jgi:hypothetical protein
MQSDLLYGEITLFHIQVLRVKLRFEVLFKKFHPRMDLTTLSLIKTYLMNTIKIF